MTSRTTFDQMITALGSPRKDGEAGALLSWCIWAVDSLEYLVILDDEAHGAAKNSRGFSPDSLDLAHVRWASSTAITSVDLIAASIGHLFAARTPKKDWDLRHLDPTVDPKRASKNRMNIPAPALDWVDDVISSQD